MEGNMRAALSFIKTGEKFIIPVYQRNYDWKIENCKRLLDDLVMLEKENKHSHFFGSVVSKPSAQYGENIIIDGQQRITTMSLLILAIYNYVKNENIDTPINMEGIRGDYLQNLSRIDSIHYKLESNPRDFDAYKRLYGDPKFYAEDSNITRNYLFFYDQVPQLGMSVEEIFHSLQKLQFMVVNLNSPEDDAQLIFESLNSTGLDLSEADKIRNFLLMNENPTEQNFLFENYWVRIEDYTEFNISSFIRDYLSFRMSKQPNRNNVYEVFTKYYNENFLGNKRQFFDEILDLALAYHQINNANTSSFKANQILSRFAQLDMTVLKQFLLPIVNDYNQQLIDERDLVGMLESVEIYVARRLISQEPSNALNKVFATLYRDLNRHFSQNEAETTRNEVLKYILLNKTNTAKIPDNDTLTNALMQRDFYNTNRNFRNYIFERLENHSHVENLNIYQGIEEGNYSIEHIMPQKLSSSWREELGPRYEEIHKRYLNSLGNLTITGYNSKYSNRPFKEKQKMEKGFKESHFVNLNRIPAESAQWTEEEIISRTEYLASLSLTIWPMFETTYQPEIIEPELLVYDGQQNYTSFKIMGYSFIDDEYKEVVTWKEFYIQIVRTLFEMDANPINNFAKSNVDSGLGWVISNQKQEDFSEIKPGIYLYTSTSNRAKFKNIKDLFDIYEIPYEALMLDVKE